MSSKGIKSADGIGFGAWKGFNCLVDGIKGFEQAINSVFPYTTVQLCIVYLIRNSLRFVPWKDRKVVAADLKSIYSASSEAATQQALSVVKQKWDDRRHSAI